MRAKIRDYCQLILVGIRVIRDEGWRIFWRRFSHWLHSQRRAGALANRPRTSKGGDGPEEATRQPPDRQSAGARSGTNDDVYARVYQGLLAAAEQRESGDYVALSETGFPPNDPPVKLIAFYLPQFHPIPENDRWWGKGFTEWANVTRAIPQFLGHYQPRRPGELGYYDLRVPEVQLRQVALAKHYGIYGFCFHFYWFEGKTLLERPLQQFLASPDSSFRFCINWANENWTRRWDGMDREILIGQNHSPEDDLAFISHVSRYLRDPRYIKVGSKPLLTVYRPALLPDARATAQRWRKWCLDNGMGEIYLALTHAFEHIDPREVGFDAAIEFAPNTFPLTDNSPRLQMANPAFRGIILDYREALEIARDYRSPAYRKFRGLCPGWDNEARTPGRGTVLMNAGPEAYAEWLRTVCQFTMSDYDADERLVFINAWNEWAESAYLEPDKRFGYAYLQATSDTLHRLSGRRSSIFTNRAVLDAVRNEPTAKHLAVVLHLYYTDLWEEMASYIENILEPFDLFVSVPADVSEKTIADITRSYPDAIILSAKNRGRDIAPFLELLEAVVARRYGAALKIHTKRSTHRVDGDRWRQDLLDRLLGSPDLVTEAVQALRLRQDIGLVVPSDHLLNLKAFIGSPDTARHLDELGRRLGVIIDYKLSFCASSMFWFKPDALAPLLSLTLDSTDFEPERGQTDGTLAHAIERFFGQVVRATGNKILTDRAILQREYSDANRSGATYYPFAERTRHRYSGSERDYTVREMSWFDNRTDYDRYVQAGFAQRRLEELALSRQKVHKGHCAYCHRNTDFQVSIGLFLGEHVHLREGLVCRRCGLSNRLRLLYKTIEDFCGGQTALADKSVFLAERITTFYSRLDKRVRNLTGSEFLDPGLRSGEVRPLGTTNVMHQDLCRTSFRDNSFDLVVHSDVLEHVADYRRALAESYRIISPGGATVFTVPFLQEREEHERRAEVSQSGEIVHHLPPAYHGNPVDPAGSLVYQTFGWQILDDLRAAGFATALIGVLTDINLGFTSSNSPGYEYMEPVVFLATRGDGQPARSPGLAG